MTELAAKTNKSEDEIKEVALVLEKMLQKIDPPP